MSQAVVGWGAALSAFKDNKDVVFGDVNLSENQIGERHGVQFNPGAGGWPTIRYFNSDTGPGGALMKK